MRKSLKDKIHYHFFEFVAILCRYVRAFNDSDQFQQATSMVSVLLSSVSSSNKTEGRPESFHYGVKGQTCVFWTWKESIRDSDLHAIMSSVSFIPPRPQPAAIGIMLQGALLWPCFIVPSRALPPKCYSHPHRGRDFVLPKPYRKPSDLPRPSRFAVSFPLQATPSPQYSQYPHLTAQAPYNHRIVRLDLTRLCGPDRLPPPPFAIEYRFSKTAQQKTDYSSS